MVDRLTPAHRSWNMSRIRGRDTKAEQVVRSLLHRNGFRYRLRPKKVYGNPDVVLTKYRAAVFVHGCFWHRHPGCQYAYTPKSNVQFWNAKFAANVTRDKMVKRALRAEGWRVFIVWECHLRKAADRTVKKLGIMIRDVD